MNRSLHLRHGLALDFDPRDGAFDGHHVIAADEPFDEDTVLQGGHFHRRLVALDLQQRFTSPEFLAGLLDDEADAAFLHRLSQPGKRHLDDAAHHSAAHDGATLLTSHRPVSAMSCAEGTDPRSNAGETGMGMSSPATRMTGSSR